jgi:hypothetical protein
LGFLDMALTAQQRAIRIEAALSEGQADRALSMWRSIPKRLLGDVGFLLGEIVVRDLESEDSKEMARVQMQERQQQQISIKEQARRAYIESDAGKQDAAHVAATIEQIQELVAQAKLDGGDVGREIAKSSWRQGDLARVLSRGVIEQVRHLRQNAVCAKQVKQKLRCTQTELERWDTQGRLPHAFKRPCFAWGKEVQARVWFRKDVARAVERVESWRAEDAQHKRAARTT